MAGAEAIGPVVEAVGLMSAVGPTSAVGLIGPDRLFTDTTGPTPPGCAFFRPAGGICQLFDPWAGPASRTGRHVGMEPSRA